MRPRLSPTRSACYLTLSGLLVLCCGAFADPPARPFLTLDDGATLLGWLPGAREARGASATVTANGQESQVPLRKGVFYWNYDLKQGAEVSIRIGDAFSRMTRVEPQPADGPCALFMVDRPACRPGRTIKYSAFLRQRLNGEYVVVKPQTVKLEIRSLKKKTLIHAADLRSSEDGRIEGEYTFDSGDALDDYRISIPGFAGSAGVKLADFRKSKVKVDIRGETVGDALKLSIAAVDFLGKPTTVSSGQLTVDVDRRPPVDPGHLRGDDFCQTEEWPANAGRLCPSPDERLLLEAGENARPGLSGEALFSFSRELTFDGEGRAELYLDLRPEWREAGKIRVSALLVDANGREQRGATQIDTGRTSAGIGLRLDAPSIEVGKRVQAHLAGEMSGGAAVLLVERVTAPALPTAPTAYYGRHPFAMYSSVPVMNAWWPGNGIGALGTQDSTPVRTLVKALPFADRRVAFSLTHPGAYRVTALVSVGEGSQRVTRQLIVKARESKPAVWLTVADGMPGPDGTLTCELRGLAMRRDLLVVLRDGKGFRQVRPVILNESGRSNLSLKLPRDCTYGAVLSVYGAGADGEMTAAHHELRVPQEQRKLPVAITAPEQVDAGDTVDVTVDIGVMERADVVITVYDQSLLGIAPDKAPDPTSFFFADCRVSDRVARDEFRRRLNTITLNQIHQAATRDSRQVNVPPTELARFGQFGSNLPVAALASALRHFDINGVVLSPALMIAHVTLEDPAMPLGDALLAAPNYSVGDFVGQLRFSLAGQTVLVDAWHTDDLSHQYPWNPYWRSGQFARGDARFSRNMYAASANSMVSAQSFVSHIPMGGVGAMDLGAGDSNGVLRRDFSDSAFFSAKVRTNSDGRATVQFKLPDSLTNWQIVATAVAPSMRVGMARQSFRSYRPVMIWPMLPLSFTEGDLVKVFGMVHNRTEGEQLMVVDLQVNNGEVKSDPVQTVRVAAGTSARVYWDYVPGKRGYSELLMGAKCAAGADASLKRLPVTPCQVETIIPIAGFAQGRHTLKIPKDVNLADARLELTVAPSLLADMMDTLPYLIAYPHGCVEQTMSRFLPVLKVSQVLDKLDIDAPEIEAKVPGYVKAGIKRLLSLQNPDGGWGWQGTGNTHEMMTPYALYGLLEAARAGYPSGNDQAVSRGLDRLKQFIDAMGDAQAADRVYCMYVYSLKRELTEAQWQWLVDQAEQRKLSDYAGALALEMATRDDRHPDLIELLAGNLHKTAAGTMGKTYWKTAGFSRWGNDRHEITAAALKALVAHNVDDPLIPRVLNFLAVTKNGNRWNSTKDTAMILYALCDYYEKAGSPEKGGGNVAVALNDGDPVRLKIDGIRPRKVFLSAEHLEPGRNHVTFEDAPIGTLFRLSLRYTKTGNSLEAINHGLDVTRQFDQIDPYTGNTIRHLKSGDAVSPGSYIQARVNVRHEDGKMQYALIRCPKPSGCQTVPLSDRRFVNQVSRHAQLREDKADRVLWHHENAGGGSWDLAIFFCELEGDFVIPPASAELMYDPNTLGSSEIFTLSIRHDLPAHP